MATNREAQRKATHNEVERCWRRDRINELIKILAQIVPACQKKDATTGSIVGYVYSKGTVLDQTVDYLKELVFQTNNSQPVPKSQRNQPKL
ncbi:upstream stimulatory factor 1-like [Halichondria panicea]|uniref:upstream stimulatory factor 1-like n=1 Tax=Halichondria panicea TaxID=6063 RepID=UPI00312B919A